MKRPKIEDASAGEPEEDRISSLPDGVLHHVLSLMPAHDAVRTCVLAKSWRNLWKLAPRLCITDDVEGHKFISFVKHLLNRRLQREAAPLESCSFIIEDSDFLEHNGRRLNRWITRALRHAVRELRVLLVDVNHHVVLREQLLVSQHLTKLELDTVITSDGVLDFSGCPNLLDLTMDCCQMHVEVMSSPSVKLLSMTDCDYMLDSRTRISFPSLVSLELNRWSGRAPLLENMPSLQTAIVRADESSFDKCLTDKFGDYCDDKRCEGCHDSDGHSYDRSDCVLLRGLSEATNLELTTEPQVFVFQRDLKWCLPFTKLKSLVLGNWFVATDFKALIWFLHHSPIQEKLTLDLSLMCEISVGEEGSYFSVEQPAASHNLKIVEVKCHHIIESKCRQIIEMVDKLLKILTGSGVPLEKINVELDDMIKC